MADDHYKRYEDFTFPQTKVLLQTKEGTEFFLGPPSIIPPPIEESSVLVIKPDEDHFSQPNVALSMPPVFSADGILLARAAADKETPIAISNTESGEIVCIIPCTDAQFIEFSPLGTFFVTWSRQSKPNCGESPQPNLKVWRVSTGELESSFNQRQLRPNMIEWNGNESVCIRLVTNEVHVYNGATPGILNQKVYHKGVSQCSVSPNPDVPIIAVFTPESGGKHAKVTLYSFDKNTLVNPAEKVQKTASCIDTGFGRTMFAANECSMKWNHTGEHVIIQTQSDVDKSNASYYGSTGLFLLSIDGKVSCKVPQSKEGHVAAAEWSPTGDFFIMAAGNMPCHITIFNKDGDAVYEFGAMHRNTISFAPHGRFLCLAGFGNLAGDMDFYDFSGNKRKKIGSANSHCAVKWGWSPDSRYFMTSTLRPRMNVDNGIKIFKYNGSGGARIDHRVDSLYDAQWRPTPPSAYPDRSRSPSRGVNKEITETTAPSKPSSAGVYRPPGSSGTLSEMMKRSSGPKGKVMSGTSGKVVGTQKSTDKFVPSAAQRPIPGLPPASIKSGTIGGAEKKSRKRNKSNKNENNTAGANDKKETSIPVEEPTAIVDKEKRIKNLRKKLKQVTELREKQACGHELNADQLKKVESEGEILKDLADLEL